MINIGVLTYKQQLSMYEITIIIKAITTNKDIDEQPRFYLKMDHFHYFISNFFPLKAEQTELNIDHRFYVPEAKPQFQLMLLLQSAQGHKKVLGGACLDVRQWPINELRCKVIPLSEIISVVVSMEYSYKSTILSEQDFEESQFDKMEQAQEQLQIKEQHAFHKTKNQQLITQLTKLKEINEKLTTQRKNMQTKVKKQNKERQWELQWRLDDLNSHKWQLQQMNIQIGAIINLVNDHGEIDICNSVLQLLARKVE